MKWTDMPQCHDCGSLRMTRRHLYSPLECENCAKAAQQRGYEQRKRHEAWLRVQGYDEGYIRTH